MNSECTINDLKETITDNINNYMKFLHDETNEFNNINNFHDLKDWYDDLKHFAKILKRLKLLKNKIDRKDSLTNYEINHYDILACKPERIDTDDENDMEYEERSLLKDKKKYFDPITNKFIYSDCKSDSESDSELDSHPESKLKLWNLRHTIP